MTQTKETPTIALISIHVQYWRAIVVGAKAYEFRSRPFAKSIEYFVVHVPELHRIAGVLHIEATEMTTHGTTAYRVRVISTDPVMGAYRPPQWAKYLTERDDIYAAALKVIDAVKEMRH